MSGPSPYELVLTPPSTQAIQTRLPNAVAAAVIEFLTGALVANPRRLGKPLRGDLAGFHSARRGTYRALYRINEDRREVVILRVEHRADAYRPQCAVAHLSGMAAHGSHGQAADHAATTRGAGGARRRAGTSGGGARAR